jgi:hypothetical protein
MQGTAKQGADADDLCRLLARHLRLHRDLLALADHTGRAPIIAPPSGARMHGHGAWDQWVLARQGLLDLVRAHDGPRLALETTALLQARPAGDGAQWRTCLLDLLARELALMQSLSRQERGLAGAMRRQLGAVRKSLLAAGRAGIARHQYQAGACSRPLAPSAGQARRSK